MNVQMQRSLITVFAALVVISSNAQSGECKITYTDISLASTYAYHYSDSAVKVFLNEKLVYSGVDKFQVYHDVNLAVNSISVYKPVKVCSVLDGESLDVSFNNVAFNNFNSIHWCNKFDSTSQWLIFRARAAFNLSTSDIYTKNKPVFDSLTKLYIARISENKDVPIDF